MDYSVRDSSIYQDPYTHKAFNEYDHSIRIGMVREEITLSDGTTKYLVEVASGGRQIPVSCFLLTKWGGVYNFEEYRVRPWVRKFPTGFLPPASAGLYEYRAGDVVLVAYMEGQGREGVILGGLKHPARDEITKSGNIEYISRFNGLETQIRKDGSYKVEFKGTPISEVGLELPPTGAALPEPVYNPLIAGSYYGFDKDGSYVVSDGDQFIKIIKKKLSGSIVIVSGNNRIDLGGNPILADMGITTDKMAIDSLSFSLKATKNITAKALQVSIKGTQMAIGSDQFELFDGLIKLIDGLGTLTVTSPVGTCTPLMAAPTWAAQILPLRIMIQTMVTSLASPDSPVKHSEGDITIGSDVGT